MRIPVRKQISPAIRTARLFADVCRSKSLTTQRQGMYSSHRPSKVCVLRVGPAIAIIAKPAHILAVTALLGETSKGNTQFSTMLATTCIAKLPHSSMLTRTEPAMQGHLQDPKTCTCTVDQIPPHGAQLSGLHRHTWAGRYSRSCNSRKVTGN